MTKMPHILVVDDEPDITETYKCILELQGFEVATANIGAEAVGLLTEARPDLIVSDCMMPVMDGIEFVRRAPLIPELSSVPIILMSGAPQHHDFSEKLHTSFMQKPLLFDDLLGEINKLLNRQKH